MQLVARVIDGELPADRGAQLVAGVLPGGDLGDEGVAITDAAVEALAGEQRELDLSEPTLLHLL
jgi:hypothetical protein